MKKHPAIRSVTSTDHKTTEIAPAPHWIHKDITITFDQRAGDFDAIVNGRKISAPSLDAMKKKIDNEKIGQFKPFKALDLIFYVDTFEKGEGITEIMVIGIEKGRGHSSTDKFRTAYTKKDYRGKMVESTGLAYVLHPDTPECRAAYQAWGEAAVAARDRAARVKAIISALHEKIGRITMESYPEAEKREEPDIKP